jgi:hypothetical protein
MSGMPQAKNAPSKAALPIVPSFKNTACAQLYQVLCRCAVENTACPTNKEIAQTFGLSSTASGAALIKYLETDGFITVKRYAQARIITITATGKKTAGDVTQPLHFSDPLAARMNPPTWRSKRANKQNRPPNYALLKPHLPKTSTDIFSRHGITHKDLCYGLLMQSYLPPNQQVLSTAPYTPGLCTAPDPFSIKPLDALPTPQAIN